MNYKYSVDDRIYNNEINNFIKNSLTLRKIRLKTMLYSLLIGGIVAIVLFIKSVIENKYDRDFIYIFLEYIIIYIAVVAVTVVFISFYFKFKVRKTLFKYWKVDHVHKLGIEDEKIYYYGVNDKKIELNNINLKEIIDLGNMWGILIIGKKNVCSIILIPKNIFESKESLNKFENLLSGKSKK
ncbi:hypothetical protein [Clostridium sp.]|uniref:hypothetical protein n=1 Tax=Clostridium sp. TaxID=1506 RepID=UPI002FCA3B51